MTFKALFLMPWFNTLIKMASPFPCNYSYQTTGFIVSKDHITDTVVKYDRGTALLEPHRTVLVKSFPLALTLQCTLECLSNCLILPTITSQPSPVSMKNGLCSLFLKKGLVTACKLFESGSL